VGAVSGGALLSQNNAARTLGFMKKAADDQNRWKAGTTALGPDVRKNEVLKRTRHTGYSPFGRARQSIQADITDLYFDGRFRQFRT
jgi:hypothetical protein